MKTIVLTLIAALLATACKYTVEKEDGRLVYRETVENGPGKDLKITMEGSVTFNDDKTAITGITPRGYVEYRNEDVSIDITPGDPKGVRISIINDGDQVAPGSSEGKKLLAEAIKRIRNLQEKKQ